MKSEMFLRTFIVISCTIGTVAFLGCESESNLDAVMSNSGKEIDSSANPSRQPPSVAMNGSDRIPPDSKLPPPDNSNSVPSNRESISGSQMFGNGNDSIQLGRPKVRRDDFVMRVSPSALERLIGRASQLENSYLQVGTYVDGKPDLNYIEFCDVYNEQRHYQFRTNGIKILVLINMADLLHNAEIDFDDIAGRMVVKLAQKR